jgi:tetratricopeptide (TPR) repeat protein
LSRKHLEAAISLYQPERHGPSVLRASVDMKVSCLANLGVLLWALGYPDEGLKRANEAVQFARSLSHPHSVANAEQFLGILYQGRRETGAAQQTAERLIELCAEHGLTMWSALAMALQGWAMAEQGETEEGIRQIRQSIAAYRATGAEFGIANIFNELAWICADGARFDEASRALTEAMAVENAGQDYFVEQAETFRLKGELLLRLNPSKVAEAQSWFERGLEVARKQSAKSFELRALSSLARLLSMRGRREEAYSMLAELYGWFTEGFDTADLKDANALLEQLQT